MPYGESKQDHTLFKMGQSPIHKGKPRYDLSDDVIVKSKTIEIPLLSTSVETSRLNKIAALLTASSILCQSISTALA